MTGTTTNPAQSTRMRLLAFGALSLLFVGLVYAWSIFSAAIGASQGWSREAMGVTFRISMIAFCLGGLGGSFIVKRTSPKTATLVAAILMGLGFIGTSLLVRDSIITLYALYGCVVSFGCGVAYNAIITTVNLWFSDKVGLSSGVMLLGYGLGSLILGTPLHYLMGAFGWRTVMVAMGLVVLGILGGYGLALRLPPAAAEKSAVPAHEQTHSLAASKTTRQMLAEPLIYLYLFFLILVTALGIGFTGDAMQGALAVGIDPGIATVLVGVLSVANGLSRLVAGALNDRRGFTSVVFYICAAGLAGSGLAAAAYTTSSHLLFVVALCFIGMCYGGIPVASACFARSQYGPEHYAQNLAVINLNIIPSSLLAGIVVAVGFPKGDAFTYLLFFALCVMALLSALAFLQYRKRYAS